MQSNINIEHFTSSMGGPSHEVIVLAKALKNEKPFCENVLDLGCGDGRNSFMLAGEGYEVTSVDNSSKYLDKLNELKQLYPRRIELVNQNVTEFVFSRQYCCILAHGLLHFLSKNDIQRLVENIKSSTKAGGINVYTTAFCELQNEIPNDFIEQGHVNALKKKELLTYYKDWEVISFELYNKWDFHPNEGFHSHPIQKFIFRKPSKNSPSLISKEIQLKQIQPATIKKLNALSVINKTSTYVIDKLGNPDFQFIYVARGPQFSFLNFSPKGYRLQLFFYDKVMLYSSNGIISGYSSFESNFFSLKPFYS